MKFVKKMFRKLINKCFQRQPEVAEFPGKDITSTNSPVDDHLQVSKLIPKIQLSLENQIRLLNQIKWKKNKVFYHGCSSISNYTNVENMRLSGTRKWVTEEPIYAVDYGYYQTGGSPYLFICELTLDVTCIEGSQFQLHGFADWGNNAPRLFPDEFCCHAQRAINSLEKFVFIDHFDQISGLYKEILIPFPLELLRVVDVLELPSNKDEARQFALNLHKTDSTGRFGMGEMTKE